MNSYIGQAVNGQTKQEKTSVSVLKSMSDLEVFEKDVSYQFLQKKAEKLATAVYLVTGFLSDNEPIKWQIREYGLSILSDIVSISDLHVYDTTRHTRNTMSDIVKITSLFKVAVAAGFMSEMNLAVLEEEYCSLVEVIEKRKIGKPESSYVFSKEFFSDAEIAHLLKDENGNAAQSFYKGQPISDNKTVLYDAKRHIVEKVEQSILHGNFLNAVPGNFSPKKLEKGSRQETILQLIRDKGDSGEVSIKDIVEHISDCGEKTVQRELGALVVKGVLKKTGERRWSRYSIKKASDG